MRTKSVPLLIALALGLGLALVFLWRGEPEGVAQAAATVAQSNTTVLTEGFEVGVPPPGWIEEAVSGTEGDWAQASDTVHPSGGGVHSGSYLAYFNSWTVYFGNATRIYTTGLDFSAVGSYYVSLWMYHDTGLSEMDRVQIEIDGGSGWTDVGSAILRYDGTTGWKEHTINLSVYAGDVISLSIKGMSDYGNDVHIDDIHVFYSPPSVLYAAPTAQGSGDCSGWADACTLQTALTSAQSGDEIWVQDGVHRPTTNPIDRMATFTLTNGVAVYGGFAGTETQRDQRDWQTNVTVLSGDIDNNDTTNPSGVVTDTANITGTNSYHVVTGGGADDTAVLDGFTITAGQANDVLLYHSGGGMYNDESSPTLTNVTFSGNTAKAGGGMYNDESSPALTNVTFSGNTANYDGGGMYNSDYSSPKLTNITFSGNTANDDGGGMLNDLSSPKLTNVTFSGNVASVGGGMYNSASHPTLLNVTFSGNTADGGGGMYNDLSSPTLTNVTFSGNMANVGGGMYNSDYSSPKLTNVTFSGNVANYIGGGVYNYNYSSPKLTNVTFSGNVAYNAGDMYNYDHSNPVLANVILREDWSYLHDVTSIPVVAYSDIRGCGGSGSGWNPACGTDNGGNIDADPRFVDADGPDNTAGTADDNLRLDFDSPAIDAGDNSAVPSGVTTDLDGNPRIVNGVVDMGAYEAPVKIYLPLVLRNTP